MKTPLLICILTISCGLTLAADPVKITVLMEALCPFCKAFMINQIYPLKQDLGDLIVPDIIPYGHATTVVDSDGNYEFTCQHGPNECYVNKVHSCVLYFYPDGNQAFEFIHCVESNDDTFAEETLSGCASSNDIEWEAINVCVNSVLGDQLLARYGQITDAIDPQYVPCVILDDDASYARNQTFQNYAIADLRTTICDYLGDGTPGC